MAIACVNLPLKMSKYNKQFYSVPALMYFPGNVIKISTNKS